MMLMPENEIGIPGKSGSEVGYIQFQIVMDLNSLWNIEVQLFFGD